MTPTPSRDLASLRAALADMDDLIQRLRHFLDLMFFAGEGHPDGAVFAAAADLARELLDRIGERLTATRELSHVASSEADLM